MKYGIRYHYTKNDYSHTTEEIPVTVDYETAEKMADELAEAMHEARNADRIKWYMVEVFERKGYRVYEVTKKGNKRQRYAAGSLIQCEVWVRNHEYEEGGKQFEIYH